VVGALSLVLALALILVIVLVGADRWWRLAAFPLFWMSALGFVQAQSRTCVAHAVNGTCELDDGSRSTLDPESARLMKARGKTVFWRATLAAGAAAIVALMLG
jgi:hypothetical protein